MRLFGYFPGDSRYSGSNAEPSYQVLKIIKYVLRIIIIFAFDCVSRRIDQAINQPTQTVLSMILL